jgi:hypothetical protein
MFEAVAQSQRLFVQPSDGSVPQIHSKPELAGAPGNIAGLK